MTTPDSKSALTLKRLAAWALGYAGRNWAPLALVIGTSLFNMTMDLVKPWPMVLLVDNALQGKPLPPLLSGIISHIIGDTTQRHLLELSVVATFLVFVLDWLGGAAASYSAVNLRASLTMSLAYDLFAKLQQLSLGFHSRKSVGETIRHLTVDCDCVATLVQSGFLPLAISMCRLLITLYIMWRINIGLTLFSVALLPYQWLVFRRYTGPMQECTRAEQRIEAKLYHFTEQTFSSILTVQAFGREESNARRFSQYGRELIRALLTGRKVERCFSFLSSLGNVAATAVVFWFAGWYALKGEINIGTVIVFLYYLSSFQGPVNSILSSFSTIQGAAVSAQRVRQLLQTKTEIVDSPRAVPFRHGRTGSAVCFQNVVFGYEPGCPVLRGVSLDVLPGQKVAIVGATGAGKSTLVGLIPRFHDPWTGRVLINGLDVREYKRDSLRRGITIVLQESFLFPMSIADNIAYSNPYAAFEQIEAAARAAGAHEFIRQLPQGYRTIIGERGARLSGGEAQRISIARALLKNAPIIILDEPTSALDTRTERDLLQALDEVTRNRTAFIIAHRLSTIRNADLVLVLKDGQIVEQGTHQELLARRSFYANYHALQFGSPASEVIETEVL